MKLAPIILSSAVLLSILGPASAQVSELDEQTFEEIHALLQPDAAEAWRQIPWQISLLEAQRAAVREKKPIFIWAMDGHPLGCT